MAECKILLRGASAGFEEKNDALVTVAPAAAGSGIAVALCSPVLYQYGGRMKKLIADTAAAAGFQDAAIDVKDKGAWDYTLKARVLAALERGMKHES